MNTLYKSVLLMFSDVANAREPASSDSQYGVPVDQCWIKTERCCYQEKEDGYASQDDYATKQTYCHPKTAQKLKCDKRNEESKPKRKPKDRVEYSKLRSFNTVR